MAIKWFAEEPGADALANRAAEIAFEVDHPVYDCVYLALAERLRTHLVTADAKMVHKLAATSYAGLMDLLI